MGRKAYLCVRGGETRIALSLKGRQVLQQHTQRQLNFLFHLWRRGGTRRGGGKRRSDQVKVVRFSRFPSARSFEFCRPFRGRSFLDIRKLNLVERHRLVRIPQCPLSRRGRNRRQKGRPA